jgi:hypothetical protein
VTVLPEQKRMILTVAQVLPKGGDRPRPSSLEHDRGRFVPQLDAVPREPPAKVDILGRPQLLRKPVDLGEDVTSYREVRRHAPWQVAIVGG